MAELARSHFSQAGKIASDRFVDAAIDPDRYPDRTAFVSSDTPDLPMIIAASVAEHRPIAVIYPDGREVVASPQAGAVVTVLAWLLSIFLSRRDQFRSSAERTEAEASIRLPADYNVVIRERAAV